MTNWHKVKPSILPLIRTQNLTKNEESQLTARAPPCSPEGSPPPPPDSDHRRGPDLPPGGRVLPRPRRRGWRGGRARHSGT
ncbi:hypothetical protein [Microcystis aeruginosa]|uniref:Uncharacterized protein n=1 Tax=Microcystis aeruginosa 11-30S32 TaxID=2358142 RepID=A0A510PQJ9_MICAE|nr:hypothetical protein [Microcystis aeruginosa]GCA96156.1 hypothetical protein MAE30S32_48080 [Microcystis aeruginosa 11-30S32]